MADDLPTVAPGPFGRIAQVDPKLRRIAAITSAAILWAATAYRWDVLYSRYRGKPLLGKDLLTAWRAVNLFTSGGAPYGAHTNFVYPPSALILLRPIGLLSAHQLAVSGLVAAMVLATAATMVSAMCVDLRWWGPAAAAATLVLTFTLSMSQEMPIENVSVLEFLGLALFFLFALRGHWLTGSAALGLALALKPMLLPVLLVLVLARRWSALGVAIGIPAVLNLIALPLVNAPGGIFKVLPSILDRTGVGAGLNSAWVDVARTLGIPEVGTIALRVVTVAVSLTAAWWSWRKLSDARLALIVCSSVLLLGVYLAGTLSENHYTLTLVPLAMTIVLARSPLRIPVCWLGMAWSLDSLDPSGSLLGLSRLPNESLFRALGMSLLLLSVLVDLVLRSRGARDRAGAGDTIHRRPAVL